MAEYPRNKESRWQRLKERLAGLDQTAGSDELLHLARAVAGVGDPAMTCEECQSWLPGYVDAEVSGLAVGQLYPDVKRHLDLCSECEAEYLEMLELALAEDAGEIPVPERLPTPDLAFLSPAPVPIPVSLPDYVRSVAEKVATLLAPRLLSDLQAISDIFFERVAALGGRFSLGPAFAPALGFGAGDVPEALKVLAATYAATQTLIEDLSPHEIAAQARAGQLRETLHRQAEKAAREARLSPQAARAFAERYAEVAGRDLEALQELAAQRYKPEGS